MLAKEKPMNCVILFIWIGLINVANYHELHRLNGVWQRVSLEWSDGNKGTDKEKIVANRIVIVKNHAMYLYGSEVDVEGSIEINIVSAVRHITFHFAFSNGSVKTMKGIYKEENGLLVVCFYYDIPERPTSFHAGSKLQVVSKYKRIK
jgi:uncharacterized protein (TIGR03067 family)